MTKEAYNHVKEYVKLEEEARKVQQGDCFYKLSHLEICKRAADLAYEYNDAVGEDGVYADYRKTIKCTDNKYILKGPFYPCDPKDLYQTIVKLLTKLSEKQ